MTKIDLRSQVQGVLPTIYGGTSNAEGAGTKWLVVKLFNDSGTTLAYGAVVTKTLAIPSLHGCTIAGEPITGVIVGYFPADGTAMTLGNAPPELMAAVCVTGFVQVLTTATASVGQYLASSTTAGKATPATTKPPGAWGYCIQRATSTFCFAIIGNIESSGASSGVTGFATPAVVLGTAAAAGAASTVIRSDSTIVAFDATVPVTQAIADTAAAGSAAVAARRDHKHGIPGFGTPSDQAYGDAASTGSATTVNHSDHKHGFPAAVDTSGLRGEILISDTPSNPLVFADLLQNDDGDDLLYADT